MTASVRQQSRASPDGALDAVVAAWSELKAHLDRRSRELSEEVRNYPTPIARCDEQLSKLIEQRSGAINELKLLLETAPAQSGSLGQRRLAALETYLARAQAFEGDDLETALRSRLSAALAGLRSKA